MQTERPRAVLACLPGSADAARAALERAGFVPAAVASDAREALALVRTHRPDLLLADAVLPGADGAGLARQIDAAPLTVYPAVLLLRPPGLEIPGGERLARFGAAVVGKPAEAAALREGFDRLAARAHRLSPERAARLDGLMDALGIPEHPGRAMLANAAALCWRDRRRLDNLRDAVYPAAARPLGRTAAQAERAIRHVIDAAWRTGEIDEQQRIFGDTIDARRGRPTCGEMIAQLADILRWEG